MLFFCKERFHAVNCCTDTSICNTSFHQLYKPLNEKTGVNASRPGKFLFACDNCLTNYEVKQVQTDNNKIEMLQTQVNDLAQGMKDIKDMLIGKASDPTMNFMPKIAIDSTGNGDKSTCSTSTIENVYGKNNGHTSVTSGHNNEVLNNIGDDTQNVENTSVLVIEKFSDINAEKESMDKIEQVIDKQNIDIKNSYKNKLGKTVIVCKSNEQRDSLKSQISSALPTLPLKSVGNMKKTIVVAGFNENYREGNIVDTLVRHNAFISDFMALKTINGEKSKVDNHISLVNVKPLKNNATLFQVVLRVTSDIRKLILRNGDKLRVGMIRCPVYDRFFAKRCFGCQQYGHFHAQCPTKNIISCGKCAGKHESRDCEVGPCDYKCVNCMRAGKTDGINHAATSLNCPVYIDEINKIQNPAKN